MMMSEFIRHTSCPECGSSDAGAIYADGSFYCFSCGHYKPGDGMKKGDETIKQTRSFLTLGYIDLKKRGIGKEIASLYQYGVAIDHKGKKVQVASYFFKGEVKAQHVRTADKEFYWLGSTGHLELFGQHLASKDSNTLVITEGEIDCLTIAQSIYSKKYSVVSLPNGAMSVKKYLSQNINFLERFEKIVLWFDMDEPGRKAISEAVEILKPGSVYVVQDPKYKDANEAYLAAGKSYIYEMIQNAQPYRPDNVVMAHDLKLDELMKKPEEINYTVGFEGYNRFLHGLRKHELVVVGAGTGVGKSTFAKHLAYDLITLHPELKVGFIALEESIEKTLLSFIAIDNGVSLGRLYLERDILTPEQYQKSYAKFKESLFLYDHFGSLDPHTMLKQIEYLAKGMGVDFIFLDHLSILVSGLDIDNERRAIDNFVTALRSFIENTGIGVVLLIHLNSNAHKKHEEGARVSIQDLRGSLSPAQLADVVIALERNIQATDKFKRRQTKIRLLKSRLFGENTGVMSILEYEHGKLIEVEAMVPAGFTEIEGGESNNDDF